MNFELDHLSRWVYLKTNSFTAGQYDFSKKAYHNFVFMVALTSLF